MSEKYTTSFTKTDFCQILKYHHWFIEDQYTLNQFYYFFVNKGFEYNEVWDIINGAKKLLIVNDATRKIGFEDVKASIEKIEQSNFDADISLRKKINAIDKKIRNFYVRNNLPHKKTDDLLKKFYKKADEISKKTNKTIEYNSTKIINNLWMLASIYAAVSEYTYDFKDDNNAQLIDDEVFLRMADAIMCKHILNFSNISFAKFYQDFNIDSFYSSPNHPLYRTITEMLSTLTTASDNARPGFNKGEELELEEIRKLLNRSPSIVLLSNSHKVNNAINILRNYINDVQKLTGEDMSTIRIKDVFLRSGSLLTQNPKNLKYTADLLEGKKVSQLIDSNVNYRNSAKKWLLTQLFPNMSIEGAKDNADFHKSILSTQASIFTSFTPSTLYDATNEMINDLFDALIEKRGKGENIYTKMEKLKNIGLDFETIYTTDNLIDIFQLHFTSKSKTQTKNGMNHMTENVRLLNKIIGIADIENVIKHNFRFLMQEPKQLHDGIEKLLRQYATDKDYDAFIKSINEYLNIHLTTQSAPSVRAPRTGNTRKNSTSLKKSEISISQTKLSKELFKMFGIEIDEKDLTQKKVKPIIKSTNPVKKPSTPPVNIEKINEAIKIAEDGNDKDEEEEDDTSLSLDMNLGDIPLDASEMEKREENNQMFEILEELYAIDKPDEAPNSIVKAVLDDQSKGAITNKLNRYKKKVLGYISGLDFEEDNDIINLLSTQISAYKNLLETNISEYANEQKEEKNLISKLHEDKKSKGGLIEGILKTEAHLITNLTKGNLEESDELNTIIENKIQTKKDLAQTITSPISKIKQEKQDVTKDYGRITTRKSALERYCDVLQEALDLIDSMSELNESKKKSEKQSATKSKQDKIDGLEAELENLRNRLKNKTATVNRKFPNAASRAETNPFYCELKKQISELESKIDRCVQEIASLNETQIY